MPSEHEIRAKIRAKNLADQAFREFIAAQKEARKQLEASKTPADRYTESIDKLNRALKQGSINQREYDRAAQQSAKTYGSEPSGGGVGRSAVEQLAKAYTYIGSAEAAMKSLNIATAAFAGDFQEAAQAAKQLPFGIGAAATAMESLASYALGFDESLKSANEKLARGLELQKETEAKIERSRKVMDAARRSGREAYILGLDDSQAARARLLDDLTQRNRALTESGRAGVPQRVIDQAKEQERQLYLAKLRKLEDEERSKEFEAIRKANAERFKELVDDQKRRVELAKKEGLARLKAFDAANASLPTGRGGASATLLSGYFQGHAEAYAMQRSAQAEDRRRQTEARRAQLAEEIARNVARIANGGAGGTAGGLSLALDGG